MREAPPYTFLVERAGRSMLRRSNPSQKQLPPRNDFPKRTLQVPMRRSSRWDRLLPKYTLGHRDRSLLISKLSNWDRRLLNRTLGRLDRTLLNRELGQPDRPLPNRTLGQRERTLLTCSVSHPDRSLPTSACTIRNDRYPAAALSARVKETPNQAAKTHDGHAKRNALAD